MLCQVQDYPKCQGQGSLSPLPSSHTAMFQCVQPVIVSSSQALQTWHFSFPYLNKDGKVDKSLVNLRWHLLYNCLRAITTSTTGGGILPYYLYLMILP